MTILTTSTIPDRRARATDGPALTGRLTFARLVRSEWIKMLSLRSTWWTLGLTAVSMVGLSLIMASSLSAMMEAEGGSLDGSDITVIIFGTFIAQITVAVLGALIVTGEYSTGMIRSTFTAAPARLPALAAKAVVLSVVVAVTGLIGTTLAYLVTLPILGDGAADLSSLENIRAVLGATAYLVLISLLAFALGAILRNSAGTIAAILGALLMLPLAFQILSAMGQEWALKVMVYLPSEAGAQLSSVGSEITQTDYAPLTWWVGGLVLLGYVSALGAVGAALVKVRDA